MIGIVAEGFKDHVCSNPYTTDLVIANLESRYPKFKAGFTLQKLENCLDLTPGMHSDVVMHLSGMEIVFSSEVWPTLKRYFDNLGDDELQRSRYNNEFFKLHLPDFIICLSWSQKRQLDQKLKNMGALQC